MGSTLLGRTGNAASVRDDGALTTHQVEEDVMFSWTSATANIAANECIITLTNDSTTQHLHITAMYAYSDVPSALDFFAPAFAAFTGTAITGVALNRTAVTVAPATAVGDSADTTLANIFATLYSNETAGDQFGVWLQLDGLLILGYHDTVAMAVVAESAVANGVIMGYYHDN